MFLPRFSRHCNQPPPPPSPPRLSIRAGAPTTTLRFTDPATARNSMRCVCAVGPPGNALAALVSAHVQAHQPHTSLPCRCVVGPPGSSSIAWSIPHIHTHQHPPTSPWVSPSPTDAPPPGPPPHPHPRSSPWVSLSYRNCGGVSPGQLPSRRSCGYAPVPRPLLRHFSNPCLSPCAAL